jgi:hypothetical protein
MKDRGGSRMTGISPRTPRVTRYKEDGFFWVETNGISWRFLGFLYTDPPGASLPVREAGMTLPLGPHLRHAVESLARGAPSAV